MLRANIQVLEDVEEQLAANTLQTVDDFRKVGEKAAVRFQEIAAVLETLEKHGWTWTTGARDIILYKDTGSKEDAIKQLGELDIPEDLVMFD